MLEKAKSYYRNLKTLKLIYGNDLVSSFLSLKNLNKVTLEPPVSGKVLVIAPHPDDELIGLGGTLRLHVLSKDEVKIAYITDGSMGFPKSYRPTQRERQEMSDKRELEAREGMEVIGVSDLTFLEYKDGKFTVNDNILRYMIQLLTNMKPDIIYMPYYFDTNRDHQQVLSLMMQALERTKLQTKVAMYEVWEPLIANLVVGIDKHASVKEDALKVHKSQLNSINYLYSSMGMSAYRGAISEAGDYAEAFLVLDSEVALKLYKRISRVFN